MSLKYFKSISVFLCLFVLLFMQSCTIYQKKPVSIQEASVSQKPVLLIRNDDTRLTFEKIEWKGENYYGILKVDGKNKTIPIKKSTIKTICLLDQTASLWGTIGIMIGSLTILGIISSSISFYDSLSGSDIFSP